MFFRKEFQGIEPPVQRTEENFDPGAKSHVADYIPYNRYNIIKLQHIGKYINLIICPYF